MSLREDLEYIWKKYPCLSPSHLIRWNFTKIGYWISGLNAGLWWTKGKLTFSKYKSRPRTARWPRKTGWWRKR